ncbi:MAG: helix-turn-helix domain-containing protein, partial [Spirochaetales bacterium]|nr:helix-turn-helix domain-containing protein [Spirochaetales bacterium]
NAPFILKTCLAMEYLLPPVFYFYLLKLGYKYNRQLKQNFSAIEGLTLNWLKWLLIMELLSWFIFFIHSILPIYFFDKFTDYSLQVAFSSVLSIAMAFFGIRRTGIFVPPLEENIPPSIKNDKEGQSYSRSGLSEKRIKEIGDKIEESVNIRKIFINPELTISMIAKDIDEKPHHISQIFNQYYNTSFYDYINSSRIEEIKHKIEEGEATEKTLLALAMESGFNSKATFNRYFKKCTGKTPSEYQKMVSAKRLSRN